DALPASRLALAGQAAQALLQEGDAAPRLAAVGLELCLTGAAGADAAAQLARAATAGEPLEVLPHASHPRQVVLALRQLHLELSLTAHGVLGQDVEHQLASDDDARGE